MVFRKPLATSDIHGKDGVGGSIPPGGSTNPMTSANAGQLCFEAVRGSHIRLGMCCEAKACLCGTVLLTCNLSP
jgi:hypothetical protein